VLAERLENSETGPQAITFSIAAWPRGRRRRLVACTRRCSASGGNSSASPGRIARLAEPDIQISSSHFTTERKLAQGCCLESQSTRASSRKIC